ncbi:hypothetical protein VIGAN_09180500 [Vigna angularis var. angularis]|uniref:RRM domain-containing protein n=1 Tax=Vigna angularis var. angularis TaxID=157739 RepID=A0A0S3SZ49_PHAAN|nr:28 kDa ribonucleoprotein, chloroplastic isoform X2 [Vigna angularis]BAT98173.1 hypothetical protein VIGAN_09180500 [Vigna angularis var. angularis]
MPHTLFHTFFTPPSSSYVLPFKLYKPQVKRFVLHFGLPRRSRTSPEPSSSSSFTSQRKTREVVEERINGEESVYPQKGDGLVDEEDNERLGKSCEVYVCNLPRSCDAAYLLDLFRPYGTILSVEVCRNDETNESKGCGYVTLGSVYSARNAVATLDGSDVDGREMRVRFSIEVNSRRRGFNKANSSTKRILYYESSHKLYVGNLPKTMRPEQLRDHFSRFGNIVGARVLLDFKQGKSRAYAFLSFQLEAERDAAMSLNGTEFYGRTLIVKEGVERTEPLTEASVSA